MELVRIYRYLRSVTIVFTLLFIFTFFDTLFAALRANHLYFSLINNTLPQCSLVLLFLCSISSYAASTQPYALLLSTHCHNAALLLFMHSHSL